MRTRTVKAGRFTLPVYTLNTVIVGSGAAGYCAADRLHAYGQTDCAIVTEDVMTGTSRNTGSDKQTYYKLTLSGGVADSVREMAQTLYSGQCVDGDIALCEAAYSAPCFLRLAELGMPFPQNRYGEYIGYKTDHDPRCRATSIGPYTSRQITERLQASVEAKGIRVFNDMQVVKLISDGRRCYGMLCLNLRREADPENAFVLFSSRNVIYATGGPAGIYADSVYPVGHSGASGLAFEAGAMGRNLTEWQYGLASVNPRWNVSGTYMQSLPRFVSINPDGGDEREFLSVAFPDKAELLSRVFLKGYQWPFDTRKLNGGSSLIDLLVYTELRKGRKVYLDFRTNPGNADIDYAGLSEEAYRYLAHAQACLGTPVRRLAHMNQPALDFYKDKGIDLHTRMLEISLCAQHHNGGLGVDCWWRTNLEGLFAVGEAAATHGVYRPGGSALNAGQVGATRAARYIASNSGGDAALDEDFDAAALTETEAFLQHVCLMVSSADNVTVYRENAARRMSATGGPVRSAQGIHHALAKVREEQKTFFQTVRVKKTNGLGEALRLRDILLCQEMVLAAMADYIAKGGKSRGSALYSDPEGLSPHRGLPEAYRFTPDDGGLSSLVQEAVRRQEGIRFTWRDVRPIPEDEGVFETVWRDFRKNGNVY
jgi:succinate dehydrogenase/fumarate reductase flavoprotein subunit